MPDVLTRSFCERCGTAYTLGNGPRLPGFASLPVVARGLRNLILSDDSLGDVIAQAREEHAGTLSARQLEAFERAFRFCMGCRQYVCRDCWNDARGRCATCAPFPEAVVVGVDVNYRAAESADLKNMLQIGVQVVSLFARQNAARERRHADVMIDVDASGVPLYDLRKTDLMIARGRAAADAALGAIRRALADV